MKYTKRGNGVYMANMRFVIPIPKGHLKEWNMMAKKLGYKNFREYADCRVAEITDLLEEEYETNE